MCDMIPAAEHWRTSLRTAQDLQHAIMGYLPGFATPRIVCDVPFVGKRWVHQVHAYDTVRGISEWTKNYRTSVEADDADALDRTYPYYDPIDTLPAEGQAWWADRQRLDAGLGALVTAELRTRGPHDGPGAVGGPPPTGPGRVPPGAAAASDRVPRRRPPQADRPGDDHRRVPVTDLRADGGAGDDAPVRADRRAQTLDGLRPGLLVAAAGIGGSMPVHLLTGPGRHSVLLALVTGTVALLMVGAWAALRVPAVRAAAVRRPYGVALAVAALAAVVPAAEMVVFPLAASAGGMLVVLLAAGTLLYRRRHAVGLTAVCVLLTVAVAASRASGTAGCR